METFSIRKISELTGVDRRTLKEYLSKYKADAVIGDFDQWSMRTVCTALSPFLCRNIITSGDVDVRELAPIDQKHYLDARLKELELSEKEGRLAPTSEMVEVLSAILKELSLGLDIIPDRLELHCGLQVDQIKQMNVIVAEIKKNLHDGCRKALTQFSE